jgi:hypothetical protein
MPMSQHILVIPGFASNILYVHFSCLTQTYDCNAVNNYEDVYKKDEKCECHDVWMSLYFTQQYLSNLLWMCGKGKRYSCEGP